MAETARENQVSSAAVKYETVADMGSGLVIAKVKLTDFREQDINARIMKTEMQKQLTDNIKKRGQLESLPFCALIDGKIEIISGHHRIRSAKDSGVLTELFVILDTTGLRRSQVAAKQLAHNAISGFDDQSTLKEIAKMIDDVDDMLESYIGKDIIGEPMAELEKLLSPKVEFDWKNVTFTFLPHQLRDLDQLVKVLGSLSPDMLGVADIDQHEEFIETITKYAGWRKATSFMDRKDLYAWHISDLKIYDQPKSLSGFSRHDFRGMNGTDVCGNESCEHYQPSGSYMLPPTCAINGCCLSKPPQSWCYVAENEEDDAL